MSSKLRKKRNSKSHFERKLFDSFVNKREVHQTNLNGGVKVYEIDGYNFKSIDYNDVDYIYFDAGEKGNKVFAIVDTNDDHISTGLEFGGVHILAKTPVVNPDTRNQYKSGDYKLMGIVIKPEDVPLFYGILKGCIKVLCDNGANDYYEHKNKLFEKLTNKAYNDESNKSISFQK